MINSMERKKARKNISIRTTLIIVFLLAMLIIIGSIGTLVFSHWLTSAGHITERIAATINENIYYRIHTFLHQPVHINEMYYSLIQNGIVNINNEMERDRFFVSVLESHDNEIYSFSFGTVNGEYYGARRNPSGAIEIMRNNAGTGGHSWYYSVNEDWTAGELVMQAGRFDSRTRQWYIAAVEAKGPVFSPVYKHFVMDDLSISAARPVYNIDGELKGVLGTHVLLSDMGSVLSDIVQDYNSHSIIVEKHTGEIISNSMGIDNFQVLQDGTFKRYSVNDIGHLVMPQIYAKYNADHDPQFLYKGENGNHFVNIKELTMEGVEWIIISAIPDSFLISEVVRNIYMALYLVAVALLLSFIVYYVITKKLIKPVYNLLQASEAFSLGDLSQRAPIVRDDEIGRITDSFNKVADKMQYVIDNLEATVEKRTEELYEAVETMKDNKERLQLILDSASEGIYGSDTEGNCTFCNISCIQMLGYSKPEDLLGKNMHSLIHYKRQDGEPYPIDECKIMKSIKEGKGVYVDDEVFWKADGTYFQAEYRSYPQIRNGEIVGAVVTFTDITERKTREENINYLSYHDTLTGLYNRRYFAENSSIVDNADNLPLSVIFADVNGLKLTNDIFGHTAGDALIKKASEILKQSCRDSDIVARVGGDEFIILLPKTDRYSVRKIMTRIRSGFSKAKVAAIKCSISIGADTKTSPDQPIEEIIANAEDEMYKDKTLNRKMINADIIDNIIDTLRLKSPGEKQHAENVSELCGDIGAALNLPDMEISKLKMIGYLHDIGKIVLDNDILLERSLDEDDLEKMRQHPIVGYRILNLFDDTVDLAEAVYSHHERWDGKGYPRGLKGEEIPLASRIVSIAEVYEKVLRREGIGSHNSKERALHVIIEGAGKQFDPKLVETFIQMIESKDNQ
jgi:diguanylate cyclase (GGDEF)-like protein/PAS domain S-box-containing protein